MYLKVLSSKERKKTNCFKTNFITSSTSFFFVWFTFSILHCCCKVLSFLNTSFLKNFFFLWPNHMNRRVQPATLQNWCLKRLGMGACFPSPVSFRWPVFGLNPPKTALNKNYTETLWYFSMSLVNVTRKVQCKEYISSLLTSLLSF